MILEKYLKEILSNTEIKWTILGEIATLKIGSKQLTAKIIEKLPGSYPVYSSATLNNGEIGRINSYIYEGEYITWTLRGNAGTVFYRNGKFNINGDCGIVIINPSVNINVRFLYYWLSITIKDNIQAGTIFNYANIHNVKETLVPLVPIETQDKLVSILDSTENCIKALEEELKLRKQQYLYLRTYLRTSLYTNLNTSLHTNLHKKWFNSNLGI